MRAGESEIEAGSRPVNTSMVETIGRALRGTLVSGMIAMKMLIRMERLRGYPEVLMMFAVISSMTPSPNINIPATAVAQSRRYYQAVRYDANGYVQMRPNLL